MISLFGARFFGSEHSKNTCLHVCEQQMLQFWILKIWDFGNFQNLCFATFHADQWDRFGTRRDDGVDELPKPHNRVSEHFFARETPCANLINRIQDFDFFDFFWIMGFSWLGPSEGREQGMGYGEPWWRKVGDIPYARSVRWSRRVELHNPLIWAPNSHKQKCSALGKFWAPQNCNWTAYCRILGEGNGFAL